MAEGASATKRFRVYARAAAGRVGIDWFEEKHWADIERRAGARPAKEAKQSPQQQMQRTDKARPERNRVRFTMEV